jgi:hypothetical protein
MAHELLATPSGGRARRMVSVSELFDALARPWRVRFQDAERESGARTIRYMLPATVRAPRKYLLRAGIRFETLWRVATQH